MLQRNSAIEDLLRHLVSIAPEKVDAEYKNQNSTFS